MDDDDKRNLYEVNELQDYDEQKGFQPQTYPGEKTHQPPSKAWPLIQTSVVVFILLVLIVILGISGLTLRNVTTANCDSTAQVGASTGSSTSNLPNCSVVYNTWADEMAKNNSMLQWKVDQLNALLQNQTARLLNMTGDTSWKVDDIYSYTAEQRVTAVNDTVNINQILQTTGDSVQRLVNIVGTLSALKDTGTSTAGVIDDILLVVDQLLELQNGSSLFNSLTPVSCQDIKTALPSSPTGYYHVNARNIYCNMDTLCGSGGGWTRLAYLNMNDSTYSCPPGFRLYQSGAVKACGRITNAPSCASVSFQTNGLSYSQICGRVVGYQYGSPDAIHMGNGNEHNNLNAEYMDGVSITRGSPRQHVWTLMAGVYEVNNVGSNCPCTAGSPQGNHIQSFVGNNYFCESGNPNSYYQGKVYTADPLWDGKGCNSLETACCSAPGLPWFHRNYGNTTTTDFIELRVCGDEGTGNEDIPISYYEIYIK